MHIEVDNTYEYEEDVKPTQLWFLYELTFSFFWLVCVRFIAAFIPKSFALVTKKYSLMRFEEN